jgi:hypothetical protein
LHHRFEATLEPDDFGFPATKSFTDGRTNVEVLNPSSESQLIDANPTVTASVTVSGDVNGVAVLPTKLTSEHGVPR